MDTYQSEKISHFLFRSKYIRTFGLVMGIMLFVNVQAESQELDTSFTISSGSGVSLGKPAESLRATSSPFHLEFDVGMVHDEDPDWEWTGSVILEMGGRVGVAFNPTLKRFLYMKWAKLYGSLGVPFFFAPYTLIGTEVALGVIYPIIPSVSLVSEFKSQIFFTGSDLPDGSIISKLDLGLGLRFDF